MTERSGANLRAIVEYYQQLSSEVTLEDFTNPMYESIKAQKLDRLAELEGQFEDRFGYTIEEHLELTDGNEL